jgi:hypothetical protein
MLNFVVFCVQGLRRKVVGRVRNAGVYVICDRERLLEFRVSDMANPLTEMAN